MTDNTCTVFFMTSKDMHDLGVADLNCFRNYLKFQKWGGGANPGADNGTCIFMTTKNIYGLGVGIWTVFEISGNFENEGVGLTPGVTIKLDLS